MIAVQVKGATDRRQIEIARYLSRIVEAAAEGIWEDVTVEVPLLTDHVPMRLVQPLSRDA